MNILSSVWQTLGIGLGIAFVLAIVFSVLIIVVSKVCEVKVDERISKTADLLANANCGACGYAGCSDYAKALVEGKADLSLCNATSNKNKSQISELLNIPYKQSTEQFAVVRCAGGINALNKYEYVGTKDCLLESLLMGGEKRCINGCIGKGTCLSVCTKNAISIKNGVSHIDKTVCEGCGLCVKSCPKKIIGLIPKNAKIYVACSAECKGKESMENCKNSCISCGLCVRNCPNGAIEMINNVPKIDYSKCSGCKTCLEKCPRKCIKEL